MKTLERQLEFDFMAEEKKSVRKTLAIGLVTGTIAAAAAYLPQRLIPTPDHDSLVDYCLRTAGVLAALAIGGASAILSALYYNPNSLLKTEED